VSKHETEAERKAREKREKEEAERRRLLGKGEAGRAADKLKARERKQAAFWDSL